MKLAFVLAPLAAILLSSAAPANTDLYQLHRTGHVYAYNGTPGSWTRLDTNEATASLAAAGDRLYQLHKGGEIWQYGGAPGVWHRLDANPATVGIVAAGERLFQIHRTGHVYAYNGTPGSWTRLDDNPATVCLNSQGSVGGGGIMVSISPHAFEELKILANLKLSAKARTVAASATVVQPKARTLPTFEECQVWLTFQGNGCGSDVVFPEARVLIPQSAFGASFTAACNQHDVCSVTLGKTREECDREFKQNLFAACEKESYAPLPCKAVASGMHVGVVVFGQEAYRQGQFEATHCPTILADRRPSSPQNGEAGRCQSEHSRCQNGSSGSDRDCVGGRDPQCREKDSKDSKDCDGKDCGRDRDQCTKDPRSWN